MTRSTVQGALMVCGTASDVGKSRIVAGLCRAFVRRGATAAPFKAQNMSLNSTVTRSGHEIARAQAFQAAAACTEADVLMGPVLLKPMGDGTSQLVVMGRVAGEVRFGGSWRPTSLLEPVVLPALDELRRRSGIVVVEGAGGAAEVNLLASDIANLPLAQRAGLPAVLVGDIERGGVFASIYGTVALLPPALRAQLRGFVINKLRGYRDLLAPGIAELEQRLGLPCLGVLPHLGDLGVDEEDSVAIDAGHLGTGGSEATLDIAVIRLPRISNFTDLAPLTLERSVLVRYVHHPSGLGDPDLIVLPGSKSTVADLQWLQEVGFGTAISAARQRGAALLGICGGFQMLGTDIIDNVESRAGHVSGLGYVPVTTSFYEEKTTRWREGRAVSGEAVRGFEIHHGQPSPAPGTPPWFWLGAEESRTAPGPGPAEPAAEGFASPDNGIWATSLHGILENDELRASLLGQVASRRSKPFVPSDFTFADTREEVIERLAAAVTAYLDIDRLLAFAGEAVPIAL